MKLLRSRNVLIICVAVVLTALLILVIYKRGETTVNNKLGESSVINTEGGSTQVMPIQPAQCDDIADTFYLSFHSNMDSLAFYNELKNNPSTENGYVKISQGLALSVAPRFNKEGCLDYVVLEHSPINLFSRSIELSDKPKEFDQEERKFRDVIIKEINKVYGSSRIKKVNDKVEHSFSNKKVRFVIGEWHVIDSARRTPNVLSCCGDEAFPKPLKKKEYHGYVYELYFYSNRYINYRDKLDTEQKLERNRLQHNEDSIERTAGQRLQ